MGLCRMTLGLLVFELLGRSLFCGLCFIFGCCMYSVCLLICLLGRIVFVIADFGLLWFGLVVLGLILLCVFFVLLACRRLVAFLCLCGWSLVGFLICFSFLLLCGLICFGILGFNCCDCCGFDLLAFRFVL